METRSSGADRAEVAALYRRHVNRGLARLAQLLGTPVEVRSAGSLVFDERDRGFLDCGGYGVFILGHGHPAVVAAAKAQLERHALATRVLLNPELARAAEALVRVAPQGLDYAYFASTGAEAVETALKLARLQGKRRLVATRGGFHGKTFGALSVTGREVFQAPFEPLLPSVTFVDYGDADVLEAALAGPPDCCVILEPVQAEGGVRIPPDDYLPAVERLCRERGALFVLDEVQTGLGRLGAWWGATRAGVTPDLLVVGKGLSGGVVPVSAVVSSPAAFAGLNRDPMLHTSTFAGSPLGAATARAAIETIDREGIVQRAGELGARMLAAVRELVADESAQLVDEVRGVGLLIGIEMAADHLAGELVVELLERRVIVSHSLNANRVVRLTPPAILTESELDWLLAALRESLRAVARHHPRAQLVT
jgi:putrescine aminotransferase